MILSGFGHRANAANNETLRQIDVAMVNNRKKDFPKIRETENDVLKIEHALKP